MQKCKQSYSWGREVECKPTSLSDWATNLSESHKCRRPGFRVPNINNVEMNMFGLWAYDATFALAMAVEKAGIAKLGFDKPNISGSGVSTDLQTLGVSRNGPRL
ncbi:hypothetical protein V6N13_113430 [Hibiscus sabdariffa]|uniref:Uncharacterized protein n=1 Tax=Hibiscus sabdariffa TaxID=183260 RepID=A0ABR2CV22_9ROSI